MLGDDALILDRHVVACKRHHPGPARTMPRIERQRVERQVFEMFFGIVISGVVGHSEYPRQNTAVRQRTRRCSNTAPSVG